MKKAGAVLGTLVTWAGISLGEFTTSNRIDRLVDYVPTDLLAPTTTSSISTPPPPSSVVVRRTHPNIVKWEKFEAEFGIKDTQSLSVKNSLREAKYQLDQTTFAMQEFVDNVRGRLQFDYGMSDSRPPSTGAQPTPPRTGLAYVLSDAIYNARFQSDIDLNLTRRPFVGVKLVLPLGN